MKFCGLEGILPEVELVKAHRFKKEKQKMTSFGPSVSERNERADDLAKGGAMLDGGGMAQIRANIVQQKREEVYAALQ